MISPFVLPRITLYRHCYIAICVVMQNTRLSTLVDRSLRQFSRWFRNPWRRLSAITIALLLGNFLATTISTVSGQRAELDVTISALLVLFCEAVSWVVYRGDVAREARQQAQQNESAAARPLLIEGLNGLKLGLMYGLFVEAFKLGS
ncbi:MAG TPA: DUF565 domain-containing protein [Allocoleopsis sp.]